DGSGSASASLVVLCATTSISQTSDAASVSGSERVWFSVILSNSGAGMAIGLSVSDYLPGGKGVNWTVDPGNSDPGGAISGTPPNQSLVYSPTTLAGITSIHAHVVGNTTGASCDTYNNTANFTTDNGGSDSASASEAVLCATTSISQTSDAASVSAGSQIGFAVVLSNSGAGMATGLSVSDNLPGGSGVNWTIDPGNSDPGWSVSGTPPNQSLVYSPTTLAGNTTAQAHVVSNTSEESCGTYNNIASFTTDNSSSATASASLVILCATTS